MARPSTMKVRVEWLVQGKKAILHSHKFRDFMQPHLRQILDSLELKMFVLSGRTYEDTAACYPCRVQWRKGCSSACDLRGRTRLDHATLTIIDVERQLTSYKAALTLKESSNVRRRGTRG